LELYLLKLVQLALLQISMVLASLFDLGHGEVELKPVRHRNDPKKTPASFPELQVLGRTDVEVPIDFWVLEVSLTGRGLLGQQVDGGPRLEDRVHVVDNELRDLLLNIVAITELEAQKAPLLFHSYEDLLHKKLIKRVLEVSQVDELVYHVQERLAGLHEHLAQKVDGLEVALRAEKDPEEVGQQLCSFREVLHPVGVLLSGDERLVLLEV
jgi:hypothetical protein